MRCWTPEIAWNSKEAIYTLDFQPIEASPGVYRLATGGIDKEIKIWWLSRDTETGQPEFRSCLKGHQGTVNTLRFSPDGRFLASGDVDGLIVVWQLSAATAAPDIFADEDVCENKEKWEVYKRFRSHLEDVSDLAWSSNSQKLLSASVDKSVIVWDVVKGVHLKLLKLHKHYVVGLCWDPIERFFVSMSQDRSFIVYNTNSYQKVASVSKAEVPDLRNPEEKINVKLFHDDTMMSFARRPDFSPDGELLFVPAGCIESGVNSVSATYVFCRHSFDKPALVIPSPEKPTIAVRCCPVLFELTDEPDSPSLFKLPYRIVFAVLNFDSVVIYDTQHLLPIAFVSNIHYANLTDLSWSQDGRMLIVSSIDAFCSVIVFDEKELGTVMKLSPENFSNIKKLEEMDVSTPLKDPEDIFTSSSGKLPKQTELGPSRSSEPQIITGETKTPRRVPLTAVPKCLPVTPQMSSATESPQSRTGGETKVPRRIQLVTISRSPQTTPGQGVTFGSRNEQTMASPVATEISVVSAAEIPMEIQSAVTADSTSPVKKPRRAVLITLD